MMEVLSIIGEATFLAGVATYLSKLLVQNSINKDLESHKAKLIEVVEKLKIELNFDFQRRLETHKSELSLIREGYISALENEKERDDRIRGQIQRWAQPILRSVQDLIHRLDNILDSAGYIMLQSPGEAVDGWSASYEYFMPSTLYFFAQYFCWARLFQQEYNREIFNSSAEMSSFLNKIKSVSKTISSFPFDKEKGDSPLFVDRQVFSLQQQAIGELLIENGTAGEVMTYREFVDKWCDTAAINFIRHIQPLEIFLQNVCAESDLRWIRLIAMRGELTELEQMCTALLPAKN